MAFVLKIGRTLRTHWKKSTFFFLLSAYGVNELKNQHEASLLRRAYCAEAKKYGDQSITLMEKPRRVTVFLNPAAQAGKARKLFEKNAAPILYLAGLEINVVKTEYEGQVKKFISVLETGETDAVVVAGGGGTLLETVTGMLRKEDKKFQSIPVGVIPLGYTNTFAKLLYGAETEAVRMIGDAAMAIVKAVTKKVDVLKIDGGESKITFALCGMTMGAYRDAEARKSKYWFFGPLKSYWTYLRTAMKQWPPTMEAHISYLVATEENMQVEDETPVQKQTTWNFVNFLFGRKTQPPSVDLRKTVEKVDEDPIDRSVSTVELTLMSPNMVPQQEGFPAIQIGIGPSQLTRSSFTEEGWRRIKVKEPQYGTEENEQLRVKNINITLTEVDKTSSQWYNIDGESFEAIPVHVSLLRNKLNVFCPTAS